MSNTVYSRNPEILTADMNGETVMMSMSNAMYYNIGEIGGRIWALLETPKSLDELVVLLMKEYDVDQERCKRDVMPFLEALKSKNLIEERAE